MSGPRRSTHLTRRRFWITLGILFLLCLFALGCGVAFGAEPVRFGTAFEALVRRAERDGWLAVLGAIVQGRLAEPVDAAILFSIRLPMVCLAAAVGASLSTCGTALQALLRNPLADPYILGLSGGAALGAALAILYGLPFLPLAAFAGALCASLLVHVLFRGRVGSDWSSRIILGGVVVNLFFSSLILLVTHIAEPAQKVRIMTWMMGSLLTERTSEIGIVLLLSLTGLVIFWVHSRDLNLLSLGDRDAAHLGVRVDRVRIVVMVTTALVTGAAVALAGLIGFVGLIVPHFLRLLIGPDHRLLVPASFLGGAAFLVFAHLAARTLTPPEEIPLGVVTALFGGPFFLFLLQRRGGGGMS